MGEPCPPQSNLEMVEIWIPITIFAAFCQNIRSALQKHLKGILSTGGATYVRFFYATPFALLYLMALRYGGPYEFPSINQKFFFFVALGAFSQIAATALLLYLFSFRNFVVGTAYSKTETIQAAIFGIFILADPLTAGAFLAILVSLTGVMALAMAHQDFGLKQLFLSLGQKTALIGLASGCFFGIAAVSVRAASLSLGNSNFFMQAAFALVFVTFLQTLVMTPYLFFRERGQLLAVLKNWKVAGVVGLAGMLGSAGWFTAMSLENAAYVRALGQIELVFTFGASFLFFKEKVKKLEALGIVLVVFGILILLLWK